jgi:hypothetical protein
MTILDALAGHGSQILLYGSVIVPLLLLGCLMLVAERPDSPR